MDVRPSNMDNANTREYLDKIRRQVCENLKRTAFAPSVQMTDVPRDPLVGGMDDEADAILDDEDEDENKDKRITKRRFDQYIEKPGELSDSEGEEENATNGIRRQPGALKRRNQVNYRNLDVTDSGVDSGLATPREASSMGGDDMETTIADTKMGETGDAPSTIAETHASPTVAQTTAEQAQEESAQEHNESVAEDQERIASPAVSQQPYPPARDEDTPMGDAGVPGSEAAPEPEGAPEVQREPEQKPESQREEKTAEARDEKDTEGQISQDKAVTEQTSTNTTKEPSPAKEEPKSGESNETGEKAPEHPKDETAPSNEEQPPKEATSEQPKESVEKSEQ